MPRQVKVKRSEVVHILQLQQHEIDNAKQRLATTKSQAIAATTNLKSAQAITNKAKSMKDKARTMMEAAISAKESADEMGIIAISNMSSAQSQYDISQKELQEAEKCLANAELKLNEVDKQYGSNKRRKVSSHLQDNTGIVSENNAVDHQEREQGEKSEPAKIGDTSSSSCSSSSNNNSAPHPASTAITNTAVDAEKKVLDSNDVVQIEVKGCGIPKINGTYVRVAGALYRKEVLSAAEDYVIYRDRSRSCDWFIGHWYIGQSSSGINFPTKPCYESPINVSRLIPPEQGWIVSVNGVYPAPSCRLISSSISQSHKKCGKCGIERKKWSYLEAEWDKLEDRERICQVCTKAEVKSTNPADQVASKLLANAIDKVANDIKGQATAAPKVHVHNSTICQSSTTANSQPYTKLNNDKQGTTEKVLDNSDQFTKAQEQRKAPPLIVHNRRSQSSASSTNNDTTRASQSNNNNNNSDTSTSTSTDFINSSPSKSVNMDELLNSMVPPNVRAAADECNDDITGARICHLSNSVSTTAANTRTITSVSNEQHIKRTIDTAVDNGRTADSQKCKERGYTSCTSNYDSDESSGISSSKLESDSDESGGNLSDNTEKDAEEEGSDDYMDECFICNDGGGKYKVCVCFNVSSSTENTKS